MNITSFSLISTLFSNPVLVFLLAFILGTVLGTIFLMISAKIFKQNNVFMNSFKIALIISLLSSLISSFSLGILGTILGIAIIVLNVYLIKRWFAVTIGRAIGIWFVEVLFTIIFISIITTLLWFFVKSTINSGVNEINKISDVASLTS